MVGVAVVAVVVAEGCKTEVVGVLLGGDCDDCDCCCCCCCSSCCCLCARLLLLLELQ